MSGLVVQGDQDEVVPETAVAKLVHKLQNQREITIDYRLVRGANHYFHNQYDGLAQSVDAYLSVAPSLVGAITTAPTPARAAAR